MSFVIAEASKIILNVQLPIRFINFFMVCGSLKNFFYIDVEREMRAVGSSVCGPVERDLELPS